MSVERTDNNVHFNIVGQTESRAATVVGGDRSVLRPAGWGWSLLPYKGPSLKIKGSGSTCSNNVQMPWRTSRSQKNTLCCWEALEFSRTLCTSKKAGKALALAQGPPR